MAPNSRLWALTDWGALNYLAATHLIQQQQQQLAAQQATINALCGAVKELRSQVASLSAPPARPVLPGARPSPTSVAGLQTTKARTL